MQRVAQVLEPVDPGLFKHADALKYRLTAVAVALVCMVGAMATV